MWVLAWRMGAKDWLVQKTALAMLNQSVVKPYGVIKRLEFDSDNRTIDADLELKGEASVVNLRVAEYNLVSKTEGVFFVIKRMTTSREWLTRLAEDFLIDRELRVPSSVQKFLPMLG